MSPFIIHKHKKFYLKNMYNNNHAVYLHNSLNIKFNLNIINISMLLQGVICMFLNILLTVCRTQISH